jgi:hypothetical protein
VNAGLVPDRAALAAEGGTATIAAAHRALLRANSCGSCLGNALLNGTICWLLNRDRGVLLWSELLVDLALTAFLVVLLVTMIETSLTRRQLRLGKLVSLPVWAPLARLPHANPARAVILSLPATALVLCLAWSLSDLLGWGQVATMDYVLAKALYTGLLGGGFAYVATRLALAD